MCEPIVCFVFQFFSSFENTHNLFQLLCCSAATATMWVHCTFTIPKLFIVTALRSGPVDFSCVFLYEPMVHDYCVFDHCICGGKVCIEGERRRRQMCRRVMKGFALTFNNKRTWGRKKKRCVVVILLSVVTSKMHMQLKRSVVLWPVRQQKQRTSSWTLTSCIWASDPPAVSHADVIF